MPRPIWSLPKSNSIPSASTKIIPSSIVNVYAPISGVIIAQNVTNAAAAGVNLFRLVDRVHHRRSVGRLDHLRRL